jgi:hypothetical protein
MRIPATVFGPGGKIIYRTQNACDVNFFEYTVHILTYCSIIKIDVDPGSYNGRQLNAYNISRTLEGEKELHTGRPEKNS